MRNNTLAIKVGNIFIGGNHHVVIQSMTNTLTANVEATVKQIHELTNLGCELVRVSVVDMQDALALGSIKKQISIPLCADIHFDYRLALVAIEQGVDKIRINPGNITSNDELKLIVDACKKHHIPIRIGINSGSIEKSLLAKYKGPTIEAMIESIKNAVTRIEKMDFYDLILSVKTTSLDDAIKVNEELAKTFNYPLHIGLTEAGTTFSGTIRSSYVLATLLNEGIGNTIRVSLHGSPLNEIPVCKEILSMCHLYDKPTLIVCPTCGRTNYDMTSIVNEIEKYLNTINKKITVALMGCVVNGPGEASHADIGIAGGKNCAMLFKKGQIIEKLPQDQIVKRLIDEINNF